MSVADWHFIQQLPADELDAVILVENAGADHLLVLVHA